MGNSMDNKKRILDFFESQSNDYWKTIDEISKSTKINAEDVGNIITKSGDFVRSSYRQKAGEPLFTTREIFRDKAPFVDKMIGAFKNRAD